MRHTSMLMFIATAIAPSSAFASTSSTSTAVAASPWIVLGVLAAVRTWACFLEASGDLDFR